MTAVTSTHIHKLRRHRHKSGNVIFFCADDCKFKISAPLALGKKTICWRCGEPFTMNEYSIRLAKPHCDKCHKPKTEIKHIPESDIPAPVQAEIHDSLKHDSEGLSLLDRLNRTLHEVKPKIEQEEEDI